MYATDFEFDGKKLSDFGFTVCSFDGSKGMESVSVGADIKFVQVSANNGGHFDLFGGSYEEPYTTTFQIMRNPCLTNGSQDDMVLSVSEATTLQRWLCRKYEYNKFKVLDSPLNNVYWNGIFTSKQILFNDMVIGLELTLTTDSPYSHIESEDIEYECKSNEPFVLSDKSDEEGYIYPDMSITIQNDGNFVLTNSLDDKKTRINGCKSGEIITLLGQKQIIKSSVEGHDIAKDFNYFYPRIINTYEKTENQFMTNLNCKIKLLYSPTIKVGVYGYRNTGDEPIKPDPTPDDPEKKDDSQNFMLTNVDYAQAQSPISFQMELVERIEVD